MNTSYNTYDVQYSAEQKANYWDIAKGLQAVDGLKTSEYLDTVAKRHIEGEIESEQAVQIVRDYYDTKERSNSPNREADQVSARIVDVLTSIPFTYSPATLNIIHEELFTGLIEAPYDREFRDVNISKPEPVLADEVVVYTDFRALDETLRYTFSVYDPSTFRLNEEAIKKFARFVADMWQVHPFIEGNTRTTAVFCILFLRDKGLSVGNDPFNKHSDFFKNALVRASYSNIRMGIYEDRSALEAFFRNLILGEQNTLRNRDLYCDELYLSKGLPNPKREFINHNSDNDNDSRDAQ